MTKEELLEIISDVYCPEGYPAAVRNALNTTVQNIQNYYCSDQDSNFLEAEVLGAVGSVEDWAFQQGFFCCLSIMSGEFWKDEALEIGGE